MTRQQDDKQADGKPRGGLGDGDDVTDDRDIECGNGGDLDDSLQTSRDGGDASAASSSSSKEKPGATKKDDDKDTESKKDDGDIGAKKVYDGIGVKKDPKDDKECKDHDGKKEDAKVGEGKNVAAVNGNATPTTQTTSPDAGETTGTDGQAAHEDHRHRPQSNSQPPVLRSNATTDTGAFGFLTDDDASAGDNSRSSGIHTRALPRLSAGSGDLYNVNELSVVSDDLSEFHPDGTINTVVAVPARSPGQIREAIQDQMEARYGRMMAEMIQQQRAGTNHPANHRNTGDTNAANNIVVAEEVMPIPGDGDDHTDPALHHGRHRNDGDDTEEKELPRRWILIAGALLCLLIVVMIVLFGFLVFPNTSNDDKPDNAERN